MRALLPWTVIVSLCAGVEAATVPIDPPRLTCNLIYDPIEDLAARKLIAELYPEIRQVIQTIPSVTWNSKFLKATHPETTARVEEIVAQLFKENSPMFAEISAEMDRMGGVQSATLWNRYFESYDKTFGSSEGYQDLVAHAHFFLSNARVANVNRHYFLDVGAGTGNFSSAMFVGPKNRFVVAVDLSRFGLEVAGKKAAKVTSQNSQRFTSIEANFLEADLKGIRFDGAIMNNVFYTMSPTQRKQALAKIFKALNSGGRFFLSDPLPKVQNAAAELEDFVKLAMVDAARQGAPLTEFDIAFAGGMNVFFMRKSPQFMSTKELIAEAQAAGFRVLDWEIGYYGQVSSLELEKP